MILSKRADVERFLSHPTAGVRAAVIWGRDRGGVHERADLLASKVCDRPNDPFDAALLTEADVDSDGARLADELSAISMLGGRRMVRLRLTGEKPTVDRATAEALTAHAEGRYNPDAFMIVEAGALERSSALRKAAEGAKAGAVSIPVYEDETGDVARFVREALAADKVGMTPEALELFVSRLPKERGVARQEIERLILYIGPGSGTTASAADLVPYLGVEPEASLSDAAADAFGGRAALAHAALRRARAEGEGGPAAVRAIGNHLNRLRKAQILTNAGAGAQEAAKSVGVFWKQEREFLRQMKSWRMDDLDALQGDVLDADRACKSAGSPDHLIVERLALSIAGRARRLGL
ncbi:DNA polymerase III subunit delta [Caulobacter sp. S45]|uniref:DNA polymerase III subunit delta n=1 Tax=Caulobacter sp. S45 TaxID=1641861 RepID=UPI00131EA489|nr:DNA polymerase III subunit delta [Caulobacter sp. S45]